jgi:2-C-methyl-D-erythritol 4-phosphate cytidylyltransferase
MKKYALIVAGGTGTRMQSAVPKQFLNLVGKPILMHTLAQFSQCPSKPEIILVLPEVEIDYWKNLCNAFSFEISHQIVSGGETRVHSVRNGLSMISEGESLVAIHDGVRPLISVEIIEKSYQTAQEQGNAVVAIPLKDSIREVTDKGNRTVNRASFRLIQTPQTFLTNMIRDAYQLAHVETMTDDASVAELAGYDICLIEGSYQNIKITTPEDLIIAEALMKN